MSTAHPTSTPQPADGSTPPAGAATQPIWHQPGLPPYGAGAGGEPDAFSYRQPYPWATHGQPSPVSHAGNGTTPAVTAPVGPPVQPVRRRRTRWLAVPAAVLAASVVSSGATAAALHAWPTGAGSTTTVTQVVQGDTASPDWTITAAKVQSSVVSITVSSSQSEALGSGVVWNADGLVVTNHHVAAALGSGAKITVEFHDGQVATATVVGSDAETDLSVLKLDHVPAGVTPVTVASTELKVGQPVMAVGNPLGLSDTVTTGIVSALNRPVIVQQETSPSGGSGSGTRGNVTPGSQTGTTSVTSAIQTNAAINPGNSGGALVNADGQLVGITSSIASLGSSSSGSSGNIGIGFAIPASQVTKVVEQLLSSGKVSHAALGVSGSDTTASTASGEVAGVGIGQVVAGSGAAAAGLRVGDVITAVNGLSITSSEELLATVRSLTVGESATVTVVRDGQTLSLDVPLTEATG